MPTTRRQFIERLGLGASSLLATSILEPAAVAISAEPADQLAGPGLSATVTIGRDTYFRNLPALVSGGLRAAEGIGAGWVPFQYDLADIQGVGLATGAGSPAGELVFDLKLSGWHVLHFCHTPLLEIWLDGERGYCELPGPQDNRLRDYRLHAADLTGRRLHIAPRRGTGPREAILFYVRAEPCGGPRPSRRNLVATNDGHDVFSDGMDTPRNISKWFSPFRDSDFYRMLWGVFGGGDLSANPAFKHATILPVAPCHHFQTWDKTFSDSLRRVQSQADILATVVASARDVGMEIHFYFRVEGFYQPFPHLGSSSRFFHENPQFRCRDEHGREVKRLSYAFLQVQDHLLGYFEELMQYQPDGLCLAFNRGLPMLICEEPVLAAFRRRHGRPPRLPQEVDSPAMLAVRHELIANFVERVHRMLAQRGKALSCIVPRNFGENLLRGLNLELLIRRGLLESVMVGGGHEDNPRYTQSHGQPPVPQDDLETVRRLKSLGAAKVYLGGCNSHGTFWPARDPMTRARRMRSILDAGLDGAYFWDCNQWFAQDWDDIRYYGDREHLEFILRGKRPAAMLRDTRSIDDLTVDRYNPWNAY